MTRNYLTLASRYIDDVLSGKIPAGKHVKEACARQKRDLKNFGKKRSPYQFDEKRAGRPCQFVELISHIKGPKAGQLIVLEPWQIFLVTTVFGWIDKEGRRRFRRVYEEVPRGNAKSTLLSALGLYMLTRDGEGGAEVYSVATTRDQAKIVFGDAQHMARKSAGLRGQFGVNINAHNINVVSTASKFEALSAEGSTLDGLNTHFAIIDELHAHKTRTVYDVIETSMGKREQSLLWAVTTAGSNRAGICYEVRGYAIKILQGVIEDDRQFAILYGLDEGDDWTADESLVKANPNWGVSVIPEVVLSLRAKAMTMAAAANNFQTKHLNEWVNADVAWMDMRAWDKCADPNLDIDAMDRGRCIIAVDLASKIDIAAKVIVFERAGHYYAFGRYYLPEERATDEINSQYAGWVTDGRLVATSGNVTDFDVIETDVREDLRKFNPMEIAYDPWNATQFATRLLADGAPMVEMPQQVRHMSEPMKKLEALVLEGKLHHDGDPVLAWMISNVVCHVDVKDNIYPRKERPENKIDGAIALIMAIGRLFVAQNQDSVYSTRGILRLEDAPPMETTIQ